MKKIFSAILIVFLLCLVLSCDNGGSSPADSSSKRQLVLNLKDSSNLYIGKSVNSGSRDIGQNKLFKITTDGYAQEVTYSYEVKIYDKNGKVKETKTEKATEVFNPEKIIKLNDNYILISFNYSDNYLVDTKTGYCFSYPFDLPYFYPYSYYSGESVQSDEAGNIYTNDWFKILKIDITNPKKLSVVQVNPSTERMEGISWAIDSQGNCAYRAYDELGNRVLRLKKNTGGYINLPGNVSYEVYFWQGLDGQIYYCCYDTPDYKIKKIDNLSYKISDVASDTNYYESWKALIRAKNKNRIVVAAEEKIYEVYNPETNSVITKEASSIGLNKIKIAISSDDYYYFVGSDESNKCRLVKVDPITYSYEYLLSDGSYDVYNLSVNDDSVIFNALRMADGAIVMGRINSDKTVDILDDKLESQVTILERIN